MTQTRALDLFVSHVLRAHAVRRLDGDVRRVAPLRLLFSGRSALRGRLRRRSPRRGGRARLCAATASVEEQRREPRTTPRQGEVHREIRRGGATEDEQREQGYEQVEVEKLWGTKPSAETHAPWEA